MMAEEIPEEFVRIRTPRGTEVLGIVESRVGFGHMRVICADKKIRTCRVPGRLRRKLWIRTGDVVIVEPLKYESEKKGEIIYKYTKTQAAWLQSKGFLKDLSM